MKQQFKQLIALLLALLCLFSATSVFAEEKSLEAMYFDMVFSTLEKHYKFDIDKSGIITDMAERALSENPELLEDFIAIAADHLDQHSAYFTREDYATFEALVNPEYVGIGITVRRMIGSVGIVSVISGSTADMAGLKAGDRIVAVDDVDVTDYALDELTPLIKGEPGTTVLLRVKRDDRIMVFSVLRAAVASPAASYQDLGEGIGYLEISSFNDTTVPVVQAADTYFKENNIKRLIIDLRDNPGGEVLSIIGSLSVFVPRGKTVVKIEYADESRNTSLRSVGTVTTPYYKNIVVLINKNTASAAELFAGNIRDHELGTIVGVTSFGKGTVQETLAMPPLPDKEMGALKLTTAEYFLPSGAPVNKVGIKPDHRVVNRVVRFPDEDFEPMQGIRDYQEGDVHNGVLAIKQRFSAIGYFVGEMDETYDRELTITVRQFQKAMELPVTGKMDYETQKAFATYLDELKVTIDEQFDKALELVKQ